MLEAFSKFRSTHSHLKSTLKTLHSIMHHHTSLPCTLHTTIPHSTTHYYITPYTPPYHTLPCTTIPHPTTHHHITPYHAPTYHTLPRTNIPHPTTHKPYHTKPHTTTLRQARKNRGDLGEGDMNSLLETSKEQSCLQKQLDACRKQHRNHKTCLQEYRAKHTLLVLWGWEIIWGFLVVFG